MAPADLALAAGTLVALACLASTVASERTLQAVSTPTGEGIVNLYPTDRFYPMPEANGPPPVPTCCPNAAGAALTTTSGCMDNNYLKGGKDTGYFYFYDGLQPAMVVKSGDTFVVEMPTPLGNAAYEEIVEGDPTLEELFAWDPETGPVQRGPFGNQFGHHMTGPIYVCGAEPGDVLQVEILDLRPHPNPGKDNRTWGATWNAFCGWQERAGYLDGKKHQAIVVYEVIYDSTGKPIYWEPQYSYRLDELANITTTCVPQNGTYLRSTPQGAGMWENPDYTFGGIHVPCEDGKQFWTFPFQYSGQLYVVPEDLKDYSVKGKYRLPVNMHIGNMGLAPKLGAPVITNPPMRTGGNIDNRRIGIGATMYYPVEVEGGLLSMGDCHGGMGDGETSCTGIETSLDGTFKVTLHKAGSLPKFVENLTYPLIENPNEFVITAYTYADWLREIPNPQTDVFKSGDLNRAYTVAFNQTREFLMGYYNLTEDESISVMGAAIDFGVTQVVDGIFGIHTIIPKWLFAKDEPAPYIPKVMAGTSRSVEQA